MTKYGQIAIVDQSQGDSGYAPHELQPICQVLDHQIRYHVQPAYRYTATPVFFYPDVSKVPDNAWPIYILEDPDVADALGYHDVDPNGKPYGRVFTTISRRAGVSLSSVLSHEVIEAFVDPYCNDWSDSGSYSVAHEACDPVQNSTYVYHGVELSNFVTREWFDAAAKRDPLRPRQFDYLDHLSAPFQLEAGGYLIVMEDGQVSQKYGEEAPIKDSPHQSYRMIVDHWQLQVKGQPSPSRTTWRKVRPLL